MNSNYKYLFLFVIIMAFVGCVCADSLSTGTTIGSKSSVNLTAGEMTFSDKAGLSVSSTTMIDGKLFTPELTETKDGKVIWGTGEKDLFIIPNPVVKFEYSYSGTSLKEIITLKEARTLSFPLTLGSDSKIIPWDNGQYKIVSATSGDTMKGLVSEKPFGIDAGKQRIEMNYVWNKSTSALDLVYDEKLKIEYPLVIDPTWTQVGTAWYATDGNDTIVMYNATGTTTFVVPANITSIWYFVVAGGGGGGGASGGGGGAGGLLNGTLSTTAGTSYTVTVGTGGVAGTAAGVKAGDGVNSTFGTNYAKGGGGGGDGGGSASYDGNAGGSSGGATYSGTVGANVSGQGFKGGYSGGSTLWSGGGGGGAGINGSNGTSWILSGSGGYGLQNNITGIMTYYAGGGGGGVYPANGTSGTGGLGGGGNGSSGAAGTSGTNGLGGGGGAGQYGGGTGGSGIVIIRYTPNVIWTNTSGCWTATDGNYTLVMWNATGSSTFTIPVGVETVDYLIVAGGGAGGSNTPGTGGPGGGGAGGMLNATNYSVTAGGLYNITVGTGGNLSSADGGNGGNSSFAGINTSGGGGGRNNGNGLDGGSGGGAASIYSYSGYAGGAGVAGQGNYGGAGGTRFNDYLAGGGGGGAEVGGGAAGGVGGTGRLNSITGCATYYAGGGAGTNKGSAGGAGGGGADGGVAGINGLGGGGGGYRGGYGGQGGSGIVIIKYLTPPLPVNITSYFTINTTSGYSPLPVQFNDTSINNPASWIWSFNNVTGNNTPVIFSTSQNPLKMFGVGNFSISLNASNSSYSNISIQTTFINVSPASFFWTARSGCWTASDGTYNYIKWNATGNSSWTSTTGNFESLIVAGGGGGGFGKNIEYGGGGGGAGGLLNGSLSNLSVGSIINISIGVGGVNRTALNQIGGNGGNTSFWIFTAYGGGGGSGGTVLPNASGNSGGSSGGSRNGSATPYAFQNSQLPLTGYGHNGSISVSGGGGGGAMSNGYSSSGGDGFISYLLPTATNYSTGGIAGGFEGCNSTEQPNNGNGDGGRGTWNITSCPGSPGIVIIKYLIVNEPYASFSVNNSSGNISATVQFTDTSTGVPTSWEWSFKNLTGNNTQILFNITQNPIYTFGIGNFSIKLNVSNSLGVGNSTQTTFINVSGVLILPVANFTSNISSGVFVLPVQFNDTSTNSPTAWNWSFGDGTYSDLQDPVKSFTTGGNFTIILNASNSAGWSNKTGYIEVYNRTNSSFISNVTSGANATAVQFNSTSSNATAWNWSFADGTYSGLENPVHIFGTGNWSIILNASNTWAFNISTQVTFINVSEVPAPVADFTSNISSGLFVLPVQFNDTSTGIPTSWNWSFGDGVYSSTQNPVHSFTSGGNYSVILTSTNAGGSTSKTKYITVYNTTHASFTSNVTSGVNATAVQFNSTSSNATAWNWSFADGTYSGLENPVHIFGTGNWSIVLNASNTWAFNISTQVTFINVSEVPAPISSFNVNVTSGVNATAVLFTDTSINATTWKWEFKNVIGNSTLTQFSLTQNPIHTFGVGNYSIHLNTSNNLIVYNDSTQATFINVSEVPAPIANFTNNVSSGLFVLPVQFNDTSTNTPTTWNWSFGDGTYSDSQNPVKSFSTGGNFTIILNASNSGGWSNKTGYITVYNRTNSSFTTNSTGGITPIAVQFNSTSSNATVWNWSFNNVTGNNTQVWFSQVENPVHTFTVGNYSIVLNASNTWHSNISIQNTWINISSVPAPVANFTANMTIYDMYAWVVQFNDTSTNSPTQWNWSFGDGRWFNTTSSSLRNATYTYAVANKYNVSLLVSNSYGSNTSYKSDFINLTSDNDNNLTSWMHMNGTNGSTTFTGEKGVAWASNGGAVISTLMPNYGGASGWFPSASSSYISTPNSTAFQFGTGDFTIEFWVNVTSVAGVDDHMISKTNNPRTRGWGLDRTNATAGDSGWDFYMGNDSGGQVFFNAPIPNKTWTFITVERISGTIYLYINGNLTASKAGFNANYDTSDPVWIARQQNNYANIYMDEFRVSKIARWTSNFTPPFNQYNGVMETIYPDVNPNSTFRYKTDPTGIAYVDNMTQRNRTVQIQNITNTSYVVGSALFNPLFGFVKSVQLNLSYYPTGMTLISSSIDNVNGQVEFNISKPTGFSPGTDRASIVDYTFAYVNYTDGSVPVSEYFAYGYLINGSTQKTYSVHNFLGTPVTYGDWNFTADFTANNLTTQPNIPVFFNSTFNGSYPNRWNWSFGDGQVDNGTNSSLTHSYTTSGVYNVSVIEYLWQNGSINSTKTRTNYITVYDVVTSSFTTNVTSGTNATAVQFNSTSANATAWNWSFRNVAGNNTQVWFNTIFNPVHTFGVGNYSIILNASNSQVYNISTQNTWINVSEVATPVSSFTSNVTSGTNATAVAFTDTSTNATTWNWSFRNTAGNNTQVWFNTSQNPVKIFGVGNFTIKLNTSNNLITYNDSVQNTWINVSEISPPSANFTSNVSSGLFVLPVAFTDTSTGLPTQWNWSLGNGVYGIGQNVNTSYFTGGNYTVILTAINLGGCTTMTKYITVYNRTNASFSQNVTTGTAPTTVVFSDDSSNTTAWNWSFNNVTGNNTQVWFSTVTNPTYTFGVGNWSIKLNASNTWDYNISTSVRFVNVSPAAVVPPVASFTPSATSGSAPLNIVFTDTSTNTPTGWNWSFNNVTGNSTQVWFSTTQSPSYTFGIGNWSIKLNASNSGGFNNSAQITFINVSQASASLFAIFSANITYGYVPLPVLFTDASTGSPTGWSWFFGDENWSASAWTQMSTAAEFVARDNAGSCVLSNGSILVMGGYGGSVYRNDTWISVNNGTNWTQVNSSSGWFGKGNPGVVVLNDSSILIFGGYNTGFTPNYFNDTWRSTDSGKTWTRQGTNASWQARSGMAPALTSDGSVIMMGGYNGGTFRDVWKTTDQGLTWTNITPPASTMWTARRFASAVVTQNQSVLLIGGSFLNDTWITVNSGTNWSQVSANASWLGREKLGAVVMPDDSVIVTTGQTNNTFYANTTFRSTDFGKTWSQINMTNPAWLARAASIIFLNKNASIVMIGGFTQAGTRPSDIWQYSPRGASTQNPVHTYSSIGNYSVALMIFNSSAMNITNRLNYINVSNAVVPIASFTATNTSGFDSVTVQFNDTSLNLPSAWNWSFNNVTGNNTEVWFSQVQNVTYTFSIGNFSIKLNASNSAGGNISSQTTFINVSTSAVVPNASFTVNTTGGFPPLAVQFNDTSEGLPTSWNWAFTNISGNNTEVWFSTVQNVSYVFGFGNWSIKLNATTSAGSNLSTQLTFINVTERPPIANFTMNVSIGYAPLAVQFNDTSMYSPDTWNWSYGDGTYNTSQNPLAHLYPIFGIYNITLNVSNVYGSSSFTDQLYVIGGGGGNVSNVTGGGGGGTSNPIPLIDFNTMLSFGVISVPAVMIMSYLVYTGRKKEQD